MKNAITSCIHKGSLLWILVSFLLISCGSTQPVTSAATPGEIKAAIESGRWVFTAERSDPPIGRSAKLSLGYEVRVGGDTAVFNLPYSGQMQAPARFPGGKGPLDFTSTRFTLNKTEKTQGKWLVMLSPQDISDIVSCTFIFFENGKASLDVIFSNRTPIDFFGTIEPLK
ncbi:MAG: DUF4251 domain-containing protein [Chitinophagaceae bacterium]